MALLDVDFKAPIRPMAHPRQPRVTREERWAARFGGFILLAVLIELTVALVGLGS